MTKLKFKVAGMASEVEKGEQVEERLNTLVLNV